MVLGRGARARLQQFTDPAFLWDPDRARIADANPAALELWGEQTIADLLDREFDPDGVLATALVSRGLASLSDGLERRVAMPLPGGPREMLCQIFDQTLKDGRRGVLVVVKAAVEGGSAEQATYLAEAARYATTSLMVCDLDGRVLSENEAAELLFGKGRDTDLAQRIGSSRVAAALVEEALIHGRAARTRTIPSRIGPRLTRLSARRIENPGTHRPAILVQAQDVEDQRTRESQSGEEISLLTDFLSTSVDLYFELDGDMRLSLLSPSVEEWLGRAPEELQGLHWRDLNEEAGLAAGEEVDSTMAAKGGWRELPLTLRREGGTIQLLSSGKVLTNERGDFRGFRIVAREDLRPVHTTADIAPVVALPIASAPSAFAQLIEDAPWAVAVHRNFTPLYVNRAFRELFDLPDETRLPTDEIALLQFFPDAERDLSRDYDDVMRDQMDHTMREVTSVAGTRSLTLNLRTRAIEWNGDRAAECIFEDVTAVRSAPPPQKDRSGAFRGALDRIPEALFLLNQDGAIEHANLAALRLLSLPDEGPAPETLADILAEADAAWARDYVNGLMSGGLERLFADGREVTLKDTNGKPVPALLALDRIENGGDPLVCAVMRDLTEWKRAKEAEAKAAEAEAASPVSDEEKSDFLANVSHELRTPLTAIIGFAQVMAREEFGSLGNPRYRQYATDIVKSGDHILSLINDLLDASKAQKGKFDLEFDSVDLRELADDCVRLMSAVAGQRQIRLGVVLPDYLPHVVADDRSVRQILLNLISNALRFTEAGGQVTVTANWDQKSGGLTLAVTDTGVGMSEDEITLAMEPFEQVEKAVANGTPGTGLGLPLARALTEANRALFHLESAPKSGTTVAITFPSTQVLDD